VPPAVAETTRVTTVDDVEFEVHLPPGRRTTLALTMARWANEGRLGR
jgi:hypothetical protein